MSVAKTEWKFLVATAFLVAIIAVPTLSSLLDEEGTHALTSTSRLPSATQAPRNPANIPENTPQALAQRVSANSLISYDLSCAHAKSKDFKIEGSYMQIKGRDCSPESEMPTMKITNQSNGYTASVFVLNGKEYQTDLIQLNHGENHIIIQYQYRSGRHEEQILNVKSDAI